MKKCSKCKTEQDEAEFYPHKGYKDGRSCWCKSCTATYHKQEKVIESKRVWRQSIKKSAIMAYGGVCACCGINELAFLTIDHIHGGGGKHRAEIKVSGGWQFYTWLKRNKWPEGFQVLCFNCNCGKSVNRGVCPHKTGGVLSL